MATSENLLDLTNRVAVVTGGAKGIGCAIAKRLGLAGAAIVIADLDIDAAEETASGIEAGGGQAFAIHADAASVSDAYKVVEQTVKHFGSIDILVNNAGFYPYSPFLEVDENTWDKILGINLKSVFFYSQAFAKELIKTKKAGSMINLASVEAVRSIKYLSPYATAKAGVVTLTKALAIELGEHKIRVNAVAPGAIQTPGTAQMRKTLRKEVMQHPLKNRRFAKHLNTLMDNVPLSREGQPDEVAQLVLFLASDASSYMTGSIVMVDGGFSLV